MNLIIGEKCIMIGTLFKKMELKPVILKELSVEVSVSFVHHQHNLVRLNYIYIYIYVCVCVCVCMGSNPMIRVI